MALADMNQIFHSSSNPSASTCTALLKQDLDLVHDGTVDSKGFPANKHSSGRWRASAFIFANEATDRIAYYGVSANLISYLVEELHQGTATAAKNVNDWQGTVFMITLLGAFVADTYWGRFRTIIITSIVYLIGLALLTLSVSVSIFKPEKCTDRNACPPATSTQVGFFFAALYIVALGSGAMKPCVSSFGADQFDETDDEEKKQKTSFFNWWFWGIHAGIFLSVTLLVYVQDNVGWSWGFGIPTMIMVLALTIFIAGMQFYRFRKPSGSPLTEIAQVIFAALCKRNLQMPPDDSHLYHNYIKSPAMRAIPHTNQFICLDKAAIIPESEDESESDSKKALNPWRLCTVEQVENTKLVIRMIAIWFGCLPYYIITPQINTLFVRQGSTMDRSFTGGFKIPAASMHAFTSITVFLFVPFYDRILVPLLRRFSAHPRGITMLQRIGIGMVITMAAMASAAGVEMRRLRASHSGYTILIFWLLPQYILLGIAEVFTIVGQIEFFYDQAPDSMQSLGSALYLANIGVGNFLSSFLITIVNNITSSHGNDPWISNNLNEGRLDRFYWLLSGLMGVSFCCYVAISKWYAYKKTDTQDHDHNQEQEQNTV